MSKFVFSVEEMGGHLNYLPAEAETAAEAGRSLEARGYRNVRLIEDEEDVALRRRIGAAEPDEKELARVKAFEAECRQLTRSQFLWQKVVSPSLPTLLMMAVFVVCQVRSRNPLSWISIIVYTGAAIFVLDIFLRVLPGALYNRLLEARAWQRDAEIISIVRRLRSLPRTLRRAIPDSELDFSEANAFARQGEMAAALALVTKYETDPKHERGAYYARLSSVYGSGRRFEERVAYSRRALALSPNSASGKIDLAHALAERAGRPVEAAALLDSISQKELKPLPWIYYLFTRGLIALAADEWSLASAFFADARQRAAAQGQNALLKGFVRKIQAYQAVAFARMGQTDAATCLWESVRKFIEAIGEIELLDAWQDAQKHPPVVASMATVA